MLLDEIYESLIALKKYDDGSLFDVVSTKNEALHDSSYYKKEVDNLRDYLLSKNEAANNFGYDPENRLSAIINNLSQSFSGTELYPSVVHKAVNLLYFIIKDHPFIDGNKRSASYLFALCFSDSGLFSKGNNDRIISDFEITLICIIVAKSSPSEKDVLISMIEYFISKKL